MDERADSCGVFDLTLPSLPPRSTLYNLPLRGWGTPYIESVTGYQIRLAKRHRVPPQCLIEYALYPLFIERFGLSAKPYTGKVLHTTNGPYMDGAGTNASSIIEVIEALTLRTDMRFTTLLPWSRIVSKRGLLRMKQAWCPFCYQAWRDANEDVYIPLLWRVAPVTICPVHGRPLRMRCPYENCQASIPVIPARTFVGYCTACYRWLGEVDDGGCLLADKVSDRDIWMATAVGEMIAAPTHLTPPPSPERAQSSLARSMGQWSGNQIQEMASAVGIEKGTLRKWIQGKNPPSLGSILSLCHGLGISPVELFTGQLCETPLVPTWKSGQPPVPPPLAKRVAVDLVALEATLQAALNMTPPPTLREVAERGGSSIGTMMYHHPEITRVLGQRSLTYREEQRVLKRARKVTEASEEIERITRSLLAQGIVPTATNIRNHLSNPHMMRIPQAYDVWRRIRTGDSAITGEAHE